jgi:hypothetical protein
MKTGDLIIIKEESWNTSLITFLKKWDWEKCLYAAVMGGGLGIPTLAPLASGEELPLMTVKNVKTGKEYRLKRLGDNSMLFEKRLVGIIIDVIKEDHRDFDIIKFFDQSSIMRYVRRAVIESAMETK